MVCAARAVAPPRITATCAGVSFSSRTSGRRPSSLMMTTRSGGSSARAGAAVSSKMAKARERTLRLYRSRARTESFPLFGEEPRHQRRIRGEDDLLAEARLGHPGDVAHLDRTRRVTGGERRTVHQHVDVVARVPMEEDVPDPPDLGANA